VTREAHGGFQAHLNPDDVPKFLNSPQTAVFDKGHLLYGLDLARKAIRVSDQAVIVEGYLDVIALHQAGFNNAISPMGTALTEHQLALLKPFSRASCPRSRRGQATGHAARPTGGAQSLGAKQRFRSRSAGYRPSQGDIRVTTLPPGLDLMGWSTAT
jgi:DNA primase